MSEFIKAIEKKLVGRKAHFQPFNDIMKELDVERNLAPESVVPYTELRQYEYQVKWRKVVSCKPDEISRVESAVFADLKNHIYGEFYQELMQLKYAIYERKEMLAQEIIDELIRKTLYD